MSNLQKQTAWTYNVNDPISPEHAHQFLYSRRYPTNVSAQKSKNA
jgi:hypothetical protein